jgi:hypothetical protein
LLLAGVTATTPPPSFGGPASTYDEAACDEELVVAPPVEPGHCEQAEPVMIVDCDDPGMTPWVAEMIGSCEMPRMNPPGYKPDAIKPARGAPMFRVQCGVACGHDQTPIRPGGFGSDDHPPALSGAIDFRHVLAASGANEPVFSIPLSPPPQRLERPPRA